MSHDVLVVGAGPAGSVTARELARRGCRVLLVDKADFPRAKVCGSCLNGAAIRTLERLGLGGVLDGAVPLDRVRIAAGSRAAEVRLPRGLALSRGEFDARLVDEAVRAGVEFRPNTMVSRSSEFLKESRVAVWATGLGGEAKPNSRLGAGVVLPAAAAPDFYAAGAIHMATGRGGYVGLVRVEYDRLDVAAAFDAAFVKASGGLGPAAAAILEEVGWPVPAGLADAEWRGTPALTRRPPRIAGRGWFAVGDAAGYVEPFTGEGIAWAVQSAAALAPVAARAARSWDHGLVSEWEAAHRRVVGRRQRGCRMVARALRSPVLTSLAVRVLHVLPAIARPFVASLNRPASQGSPA
jgi:flavin-dependent dehydrogenase